MDAPTAAMGMASARLHEVGAFRASGTRSVKTALTGTGKLALDIPRDRLSTFDPQRIAKYQRRFPGFDEKIVSMYARFDDDARDPGAPAPCSMGSTFLRIWSTPSRTPFRRR